MRRSHLLTIASGLGLGGLVAWAVWFEPRRLVVRELEVSVNWWPESLDGLTISVVADLHVGSPHVDVARVEKIVERINGLTPDLICLLGDYVAQDMRLGRRVPADTACAPLQRLRARLGICAVLGDHDWELNADGVVAALGQAGITVLEDDAAPVGNRGLWVAGVSQTWRAEADAATALRGVPAGTPTLVLAHSPDVFPSLPSDVALTLAGHTHGGQVGIRVLTQRSIPSRYGARYLGGLYREGSKQLFVNTGIGTSRVPVRFLVPPQITLLTMRTGDAQQATPRD